MILIEFNPYGVFVWEDEFEGEWVDEFKWI